MDELIEFDININKIQEIIDRIDYKTSEKIDWTKAWSKKYSILVQYKNEVEESYYEKELDRLTDDIKKKYNYDDLNVFLVLKDILAAVWKSKEKK